MRALPLLLASIPALGCTPRIDQVIPGPALVMTGSRGAIPGYAVKQVRGRLRDTEVLGHDGSVCRLIPERYAHVKSGDWLACNWTITLDTLPSIARASASGGTTAHRETDLTGARLAETWCQ